MRPLISAHLGLYRTFLRKLELIENEHVRNKLRYNVRSVFEVQRYELTSENSTALLRTGRNDLEVLRFVCELDGESQQRLFSNWRGN